MTESEWLGCQEPRAMLDWLQAQGTLTERKFRLFAVACCRRIWPLIADEPSRKNVETAEQYADGVVHEEQLPSPDALPAFDLAERMRAMQASKATQCACEAAQCAAARPTEPMDLSYLCRSVAYYAAGAVAWNKVGLVTRSSLAAEWAAAWNAAEAEEYKEQACILRDIVGDPFRSRRFCGLDPGGRNADVLTLAGHIYDDRDFRLITELAAAVEAAGCTDAQLLGHLRSPAPHCRGCWALDAVLGKT